jgi:cytochrome c-type biogenesis protein CcmF
MAAFGTLTLLIALVVATYAGAASFVGIRRGSRRLIESGRAGVYALAGVLGMSSVAIWYAFLTHDYSIKYVHRYSDASSPIFYQITAYWGGLDGSILWWAFLLSVFSAIAVYTNRQRHRELLPYAITVLMVIADFFLFLIVFHKNPFDTYMGDIPTAGKGLNPLLQNAYMVTHPPSLYTGFVGMSIPFAFGMAALISGQLDDAWIASVRRWTLGAWFFLSLGLTLGMLWAYVELGWGGFWGWDPVENAGFLPWLTATAFLHSVMIQERRGMMKIWNVTLIILTFFLTIFGTFMTRSGIVQSVHAFGQDSKLAWMFTVFMVFLLVVSFGFVIKRMPELRSRARFESWLSREAAFTVNNWILLFSAFAILFFTMFPTLSEALGQGRITVGPPFFNLWMVPIGLALLFLTGVGPLIAWRRATAGNLRYQFLYPGLAALVTVAACMVVGLHRGPGADASAAFGSTLGRAAAALKGFAPVACFGLCAFVMVAIGQEFFRNLGIRKRNTRSDAFTAAIGMVLRNRRRYGGYLVHLGIVLMFLGFAGTAYQQETEAHLAPGQTAVVGNYTIRFDRLAHEEDRQKEMVTGEISVLVGGQVIDQMRPARWFFHGHESEPTTEVALHRTLKEDLYLTLGNYDLGEGSGMLKLVVNPVVNWIWLGFILLAIGTGITLITEPMLDRLLGRAPPETGAGPPGVDLPRHSGLGSGPAALAVAVGLGLLLAGGTPALAQMAGARGNEAPAPQGADENWLVRNIVCQCGSCRHNLIECASENCGHSIQDRIEIHQLLAQGKTRQDVIQYFIQKYGSQVALAAPIDKGFNRLAWALPYGFGVAAAGALAYGAYRLSRRPKSAAVTAGAPTTAAADPELRDQLDDELRGLD